MDGYIDAESAWILTVSGGQIIEARAFQSDVLGSSPWYKTRWTLAERERYLRVQIWAMAQCDLEGTRMLLQTVLGAVSQDVLERQAAIDVGLELLGGHTNAIEGDEDGRREFRGTISSDCEAS